VRARVYLFILLYRVCHFKWCSWISRYSPWRFRWKCFKQKLVLWYGFKGAIKWCHWFYLEKSFEDHVKVTFNFLNRTPNFLLLILVAYLERFPEHYNKVFLHWVHTVVFKKKYGIANYIFFLYINWFFSLFCT